MSAALQAAAHQPAALASPPLPSPSGRGFMSPHSSPNREAYHANQSMTASPSSRRPPSRRMSGNGEPASQQHRRSGPAKSQPSDRRPATADRPSAPVAPPRTSSSAQHAPPRSHQQAAAMAAFNLPQGPRPEPRVDNADSHKNKRASNPYPTHESSSSSSRPLDGPSIPFRSIQQPPTAPTPRDAPETFDPDALMDPRNGRASYHGPSTTHDMVAPSPVVGAAEERRGGRSRHDHSRAHKGTSKFGDFILGNTIGEGEFGKVKLGWKQDSSVQVAIKLIKRDTVGGNPSRLGKIRREVTILRGVQHPNIVRLIDMIETDRYIGIILEYASGGELFDYILNHRYLKDHSARRLFAQLVSGVGYLHKKGIVHRDLKLENLLLDRNRNIIITDFGFANTFDPNEELSEDEELNLTDRDFVKRMGLDKVKANGTRRGDLMQTSCGSPCYAAPELVVSDSLYTGRKVDVWSCGVILYAMLAGYLPFDDDPANPEGDNINLLYKYIVSTPLTFPEYVTPHARDLLRRILVPNPRKRADLFEVARHSWLSEYAHLVEFITSSTTSPAEAQDAASASSPFPEPPSVGRSASVREATPKHKSVVPAPGGGHLAMAHTLHAEPGHRTPKDAKRRTVQVEYVAPTTQTQRGTDPGASSAQAGRRYEEDTLQGSPSRDRPSSRDTAAPPKPPRSSQGNGPPPRVTRDMRSISDNAFGAGSGARPQTGGSTQSVASMALQSRGNYGQPVPPTIADTNAQGRIQQPSNAGSSSGGGAEDSAATGRPSSGVPPKFARVSGYHDSRGSENRGHKRSSTIGDISSRLLGRSGSVFGGKSKKRPEQAAENKKRPEQQAAEKTKRYPPVSMSNSLSAGDESGPRPSMESKVSRRSTSMAVSKKRSGSVSGSQGSGEKKDRRRFSLLPASFSLKAIGLGRDTGDGPGAETDAQTDTSRPARSPMAVATAAPAEGAQGSPTTPFDSSNENAHEVRRLSAVPARVQQSGSHFNSASESSMEMRRPPTEPRTGSRGHHEADEGRGSRSNRGSLQRSHKRFTDAYEQGEYRGHEGSSGAAKRVMDFFRRRGRARGGDER
ncbi:hypothetical protein XA68_14550 [Ophiocordyceps unilateralis]|uniref:non-specific serine/threonine protein kinase n=1 Tax=Ophiocordyceps unilateralis TaxID=268505 RepID=A0A2A9PAF2_OPHUN|nr:hypothetical protein XA68_14550 [Ophiocordyceps unilateralis]